MDNEKILFCYRDDKIKKPIIFDTKDAIKQVAAVPCSRKFLGKTIPVSQNRIKREIAEIYEKTEAGYLWLEDELCEFLKMKKMEYPEMLFERWLAEIPFFHTLIFADDTKGRAIDYILGKTERVAAVCVVCEGERISDYEELAVTLFQREGIILQIFTYEMLEDHSRLFEKELIVKGRAALLDFDEKRSFWDRRLLKDMRYYSFGKEIRLFLDTFQKNGYNTLTK